jgi:fatty acid desaturase
MNTELLYQEFDHRGLKIPALLNVVILFVSITLCMYLLHACSVTPFLAYKILCAALFSFICNTIFSLLHEAVHGHFHSNAKLNYFFGIICAAFYPTGFSLQRNFHLAHHKNNRTEKEQFDYLHQGDNKFFKYAQWYSILTGFYWVVALFGAILIMLVPEFLIESLKKHKLALQTGAESMFSRLKEENYNRIRLEILFSFLFQTILFLLLKPTLLAYGLCYGFFAINWSSLQYADHAFSTLDSKEGAWNLRVSRFTQYLFLNYHSHKVHHINMNIPWLYLPKFVKPTEYRPWFINLYYEMWKGPKFMPQNDQEASLMHPAMTNREAEWICLKEFYHYSRRHKRYFTIGLFLYLPSFLAFKKLRAFRFGFCLLQYIDDLMDGDRSFLGDPLEVSTNLKQQLHLGVFEPNRCGILAAMLFKNISGIKANSEELRREFITLIQIMESDYKRRTNKEVLNQNELNNIIHGTFRHSVNISLILWESPLRAVDVIDLIKCFAWVSTMRDLREDLKIGIINIPNTVMDQCQIKDCTQVDLLLKEPTIQHWLTQGYKEIAIRFESSTLRMAELKSTKGFFILNIFHQSMLSFHKRFQSNIFLSQNE